MTIPTQGGGTRAPKAARIAAKLQRLLACSGGASGQSFVEYLIVVGACALVEMIGFTQYGKTVNSDLAANAKHIEGEGLPNTENILSSLGADYNTAPVGA